jgi:hypothetical protein
VRDGKGLMRPNYHLPRFSSTRPPASPWICKTAL